jgi:hypothetical protein
MQCAPRYGETTTYTNKHNKRYPTITTTSRPAHVTGEEGTQQFAGILPNSPTQPLCCTHHAYTPPLTAHTLHCSKGTAGGTAQLAQLIQRPSYTVWAGSRMHQGLVVPPHTNPWQWQTQCMHATAHTMVHNLRTPLHAHYREHPLPTLTVHTMHCSKGTQLGGGFSWDR